MTDSKRILIKQKSDYEKGLEKDKKARQSQKPPSVASGRTYR